MELIAQKRKELGKQTQSIKENRKIPAVIFGKGLESLSITVDLIQFEKMFAQAGETTMIDLNVDGKMHKVLVKEIQYDPVTMAPIHASFYQVNLKEKIKAQVPVEVIGDEKNPLIKSGEALVLVLLNEIEVESLPSDIPSKFVIDISNMSTLGDEVTISQLDFDKKKVEIKGHKEDDVVLRMDRAQMAEEPVEEVVVDEAEAIAKVAATKELSEEEKAKRAEEDKAEKAEKAKKEKK